MKNKYKYIVTLHVSMNFLPIFNSSQYYIQYYTEVPIGKVEVQ